MIFLNRLLPLVFTFLACQGNSQNIYDTSLRYNKAINYLNGNKQKVKEQWLNLFSGRDKRMWKKKISKGIDIKISPRICFLQILTFRDEIKNIDNITKHKMIEIKEPNVYFAKYGFESFLSAYLEKNKLSDSVTKTFENTLIVNFSKPTNNYLIAEISPYVDRMTQCNIKIMGRTMWALFIFNPDESLRNIYYSYLDH